MNTKMENTRELNFEEIKKVSGGTGMDAQLFIQHLSRKYGTKRLVEIRNQWTSEEKDFFDRAMNRKVGDEPLGPYPD